MLDFAFNTGRMGHVLAQLLATLWTPPDEVVVRRRMVDLVGDPSFFAYIPATDSQTAYAIGVYPSLVLVLFQGVSRLSHAQLYVGGFWPHLTTITPPPRNNYCVLVGSTVAEYLKTNNLVRGRRVIIGGHSLGGGHAIMTLAYLADAMASEVAAITFGMPKVIGGSGLQDMERRRFIRWMNEGDPVPRVYPRQQDSLIVGLLTNPQLALTADLLVQPSGGILLKDGGGWEPANLPPVQSVDFGLDVAAWVNAVDGNPAHPHHLDRYVAKLAAIAEAEVRPGDVVPLHNFQQRPVPRQRLRLADMVAEVARRQEAVHDTPQADPPPRRVVSAKPFTVEREGILFQVHWAGALIASCRTEAKARNMAKAGNRFLAHYVRAGVQSDQEFVEAAKRFFERSFLF